MDGMEWMEGMEWNEGHLNGMVREGPDNSGSTEWNGPGLEDLMPRAARAVDQPSAGMLVM